MTSPGYAHRPSGVTSHLSPTARYTLAAGLLALGIGDLAVINTVLLPRHFAMPQATRMVSRAIARAVALPAAVPPPSASPPPAAMSGTEPIAPSQEIAAAPTVVPLPVAAEPPPTPAPAPLAADPPPLLAVREEGRGEGPPDASAPAAADIPDLLFALNATWLSLSSRTTLDGVTDLLKEGPTRRVVLSGHTDRIGAPDANRALSLARARRAGRYLRAHGIGPAQIEVRSFGSARPADGETSREARARNRRVEIAIQ